MSEQELKDSLIGLILGFGQHMAYLGQYRLLAEHDNTWHEVIAKSEEKAKEILKQIGVEINKLQPREDVCG